MNRALISSIFLTVVVVTTYLNVAEGKGKKEMKVNPAVCNSAKGFMETAIKDVQKDCIKDKRCPAKCFALLTFLPMGQSFKLTPDRLRSWYNQKLQVSSPTFYKQLMEIAERNCFPDFGSKNPALNVNKTSCHSYQLVADVGNCMRSNAFKNCATH